MAKMFIGSRNIIVNGLFLLALQACSNDLKEYHGRHGMFTPAPFAIGQIPQGDDDYSQGFRDGCNTAYGIMGTGMLSSSYDSNYYDYEKSITNNDYYKGRTIGFNYCTYYLDNDPL